MIFILDEAKKLEKLTLILFRYTDTRVNYVDFKLILIGYLHVYMDFSWLSKLKGIWLQA